jgi:NAD(P)-dependent dehydrogenase (short-subunit alcohol dehydrogenase family)
MDLRLAGKSVLITGASKGIGLAAARAFAAEGCNLHLAARSGEALAAARRELTAEHRVAVDVHVVDLGRGGNVVELGKRCAGVDILVNNAGEIPSGPIESLSEDDWRRGYDLKLFGYILLTREIYAAMKARGSGVIINDIGNSGENWDANYIAGSTANAALMAFTKALGGQSLDFGVRVVGVNPGPVATDRLVGLMKTEAKRKFGDESRWREFEKGFPFGRAATVEEIAATVALLASDLSSYTTGTVVTLDGGMVNRGSLI